MDKLISRMAIGNLGEKKQIYRTWLKEAGKRGIYFASTQALYREAPLGFWVPAFNLRGLTDTLARAVFAAAKKINSPFFIFEIARTEISYTAQPPLEYAGLVLKAAIDEKWSGPIFLQADHLQMNPAKYNHTLRKELNIVKRIIKESIRAGFYNLDIDCSPLGREQNIAYTANLVRFVDYLENRTEKKRWETKHNPFYDRGLQKINLGIEVDAIGSDNTSPADLEEYLGEMRKMGIIGEKLKSVTKVACQVGTEHGGRVNPDGSLARMEVDFELLRQLNTQARKHSMAGTVLHGASTLQEDQLAQAIKAGIIEMHLATNFQNLIFDHPDFPQALTQKMQDYLDNHFIKKENETPAQFYYNNRKQCFGVFKRELISLPDSFREKVREAMEAKAAVIFQSANQKNIAEKLQQIYEGSRN